MINSDRVVRLSLPSKGRMEEESINFLKACGLKVYKTNPRQYEARIPSLPGLTVIFQRPGDIVVSVREGSVDFGISGLDVIEERKGDQDSVLTLHDDLKFGSCSLALAVPEELDVRNMRDLQWFAGKSEMPLRVATKFPVLTARFLDQHEITYKLISAEGALETAPTIGYADIISDLVSSGQTLRDNRLRQIEGGLILKSQAALIANVRSLKRNPVTLDLAQRLLEYIEAYQRAEECLAVFANMRGSSPQAIGEKIFKQTSLGGLQGPTISPIIAPDGDPNWFAVNVVVQRKDIFQAVEDLRSIGGSGVVVMPVSYIFEEEPPRISALHKTLAKIAD
ncbi:MAG: ATP phosphoribosyltransferase [Anaerolineaceae bacterium]|nr:ATP phosphoribosyltransferase [Anaerolineaceae bacterium]